MRILLTNDDGIYAPGIKALGRALTKRNFDVTIMAVEFQRSGDSKAITFNEPVRIKEVNLKYMNKEGFTISGTPADAVIHAMHYYRNDKNKNPFDLVVSGINAGENTSLHSILTSGTCAAAFESAFLGTPAIAFSLDVDEEHFFNENAKGLPFDIAAERAVDIIEWTLKDEWPEKVGFINVNFPKNVSTETKIKITPLEIQKYRDYTIERKDPRGQKYFWIWGDRITMNPETDAHTVIVEKLISITPISLELIASNTELLASMKELYKKFE